MTVKPEATPQEQEQALALWSEPFAKVCGGMLYKAMLRAYNGSWENQDLQWAWDRLQEELGELSDAMNDHASYEEVQHEVADCCNFLAILLDLYQRDGLHRASTTSQP